MPIDRNTRRYLNAQVSLKEHRFRYSLASWPWASVGNFADLDMQHLLACVQTDGEGPLAMMVEKQGTLICAPRLDLSTQCNFWSVYPGTDVQLEAEDDTLSGEADDGSFNVQWVRQKKQTNAAGNYVTSMWQSHWEACVNPFLLVGLRRMALPKDYKKTDTEPYTSVFLGTTADAGIEIVFPYRRSSFIRLNQSSGWKGAAWYDYNWTSGNLSFSSRGGDKGEDALVFMVGFVDGDLCCWELGDPRPKAVFSYGPQGTSHSGIDDAWLWCQQANIEVVHTLGEVAVLARPIILEPSQLAGPPVYVGRSAYGPQETVGVMPYGYCMTDAGYVKTVPVSFILDFGLTNTYPSLVWQIPPAAGQATVGRCGAGDAPTFAPDYYTTWFAELKPYQFTSTWNEGGNGNQSVTTYSSPGLVGVDLWQAASLMDGGAVAEAENITLAGKVHGIEPNSPDNWAPSQCNIILNNRREQGGWANDLGILRQFTIDSVDWYDGSGGGTPQAEGVNAVLGAFWTLEPDYEGVFIRTPCVALDGLLALQKCHGEIRPGDGTNLSRYIGDALYGSLIGDDFQDLEDIGIAIPYSPDQRKRLWYPKRGVSLIEYLRELQEKIGCGGAIWADGEIITTGCKYCGTKRTGTLGDANYYKSHNDNGWASSACLAADAARITGGVDFALIGSQTYYAGLSGAAVPLECISLQRLSRTLVDQFANYVDVAGKDQFSRPITAAAYDYASVTDSSAANYAGGMVIPYVEESSTINTQADAQARANTILGDKSRQPLWIEATFPTEPTLKRGMVVQVHGWPHYGVDGLKARIAQVSPPIVRDNLPITKIRARVFA
jgi:hypothetical protein